MKIQAFECHCLSWQFVVDVRENLPFVDNRSLMLVREHITVTAEKASKHSIDKNSSITPHNGRFIVSSSISMYLEKRKFIR
jgi:hypothetical protein